MLELSRRSHLQQLSAVFGSAALPGWSRSAGASEADIPPEGIGKGIKHISYSDIGGRPDSVQVMFNRQHVYVGHMFSDGVTILDASDPRALKPVNFFTAGQYTRTHHLQVAEDLLLLANGANIVAMQSYDNMRGYFENTLVDSITKRQEVPLPGCRSTTSPSRTRCARSRSSKCPASASTGCGGRAGATPMCRRISTASPTTSFAWSICKTITKPEIVSKWWLPGMNRAAGEPATPKGKRFALHHMITAGDRGYAAWRDGGFTIHDISDPANPKLLSHINWSPPFAGGTHTPLPLPRRQLAIVADEANADNCAKGLFHTFVLDVRAPENPVPIATLPTPRDRDFCTNGTFGPHNLHENRPGSFQSEETIFATYNNAGVRVFDIRDAFAPKEIAYWVPPTPKKLIDPRPNVALAAKTCDAYVRPDGMMFVSDWNAGMHVLQYQG